MIGLCTAMIGMILIVALPLSNNSGRLAGYYLTQASPTPFVALLSLIASNVAGYTKKTTVAAMYLIGYCVGNIIGKLLQGVTTLSKQSEFFGQDGWCDSPAIVLTVVQQARKPSVPATHRATSPPK